MNDSASSRPSLPPVAYVDDLVSFALDVLPSTRLPSGRYCYDRPFGGGPPRGESVRYSLMVLIGLQRAEAAGRPTGIDLDDLFERCIDRRSAFSAGDLGLAMWADARRDGALGPGLLADIDRMVPDDIALAPLVGMEVAWLLIGLASSVERLPASLVCLRRILDHLRSQRLAPSGLCYHDGRKHLRHRLPNFATEIYAVLALAVLSRLGLDERAKSEAVRLADHLIRLQLPDGGWPWLFDAERAMVVERYEVYSVHQDAMAPMALLELTAATNDGRYAAAARRGLSWSTGHNELGVNLLDRDAAFAHRSIRRRSPWDRAALAANSASVLAIGRPLRTSGGNLELNQTCRPYHLGWILEAWAGRETAGVDHG